MLKLSILHTLNSVIMKATREATTCDFSKPNPQKYVICNPNRHLQSKMP